MNTSTKIIIVYNNEALSSYLWMHNGTKWYLFPFLEGRDLYPCFDKKFTLQNLNYNSLPDSLKKELKADDFDNNIKVIYCL
ncbi:hypothetical protein [Niabella beijingensis]|uniref:hypothetical protein n=1 Tax=Niabella beijingensis TaxID=2872700 RepID=UPI001CC0265F|nr:hypothetical protein [Niabella beijingensis]MBZ4187633.1 hypothetical protein [Niabella beijingensis]